MSITLFHAGVRLGLRAWSPLIAAAAIGCCVSACTGGTSSSASSTPAGSSQPASPGTAASSSTQADPAQGTVGARSGTPGATLADWIHQVAAGNRSAACHDMREPKLSAQRSTALCMSAAAKSTFTSLQSVFGGIKPSDTVSVDSVHVTGATATASSSHVHVSGQTLDSLIAARSTGVKPGQVSIAFKLSRIDGAWYVTDMGLNF